jgi:aryl-alcohol dehydrogenase-like predicted oxidoreductase
MRGAQSGVQTVTVLSTTIPIGVTLGQTLATEAMQKNQALVDLLKRIAREKNATPAQLALAWLLAQRPSIVPIPGTTKFHRLQENIGASTVELTAADLAEIERAAAAIQVEDDRYPPQLQAMIGR